MGGGHLRTAASDLLHIVIKSVTERNIEYNVVQYKQFSAICVRRALCLMMTDFRYTVQSD